MLNNLTFFISYGREPITYFTNVFKNVNNLLDGEWRYWLYLTTWVQVAAFFTYWLEASLVTTRRRREQHGRSSAVPHYLGPGGGILHLLAGGISGHRQEKEGTAR